ncbi:hypothetical protein BX661DRAFT_186564 [Kickxella alabastrina]|uniref:uncharacterized protein n=1 Tax=Kickxella alabastrina TaxID=61397 RepID=UPI002220C77D|nr:uncharacterized protein BX661DRAFT_186564 [Kickxella alabastrina]KAI7823421.1 hypothetical protein BX661DRAFT_186564 [Kickxella alabastrina]
MLVFKVLAFLVAGLSLVLANIVKKQTFPTVLNFIANGNIGDMERLTYLVLIKGDTSTQCERIAGIVAANCVEWNSDRTFSRTDYKVAYFAAGNGDNVVKAVNQIKMHPSYDATTFATILRLFHSRASLAAPIVNRYHTFRTLASISPLQATYSPLYAANAVDYACNSLNVNSYNSPGCVTGYSSIYGATDGSVAIHALYSYSVTDVTTGLCGVKNVVMNYYTVLRNYLPWAVQESGMSYISIHSANIPYESPNTSGGRSVVNNSPAIDGKIALNGLDVQPATTSTLTVLTTETDTTTIEVTETVTASSTEFISTTTVNTISTIESATATTTSTVTTTETTMLTSVIGATSMDIATSTTFTTTTFSDTILFTATVTDMVTAPIVNTVNTQGNNINIGLDVGQKNVATVTATTTQTVSSVSTITNTSVLSLTTTLILPDSNIPQQATTVVLPASTVTLTDINTVTVTTESTSLITSFYTVTYVPSTTKLDNVQTTVSGVTTVTRTVPSISLVTMFEYKTFHKRVDKL